MPYCLDSSTVSDIMAGDSRTLARLAEARRSDSVFIAAIVRGEILHGAIRLPDGKRKSQLLERAMKVLSVLPCEPIVPEVADHYATLKSTAASQGLALSDNDLWIAGLAIHRGATLVTRDRDFLRGGFVTVQDWSEA